MSRSTIGAGLLALLALLAAGCSAGSAVPQDGRVAQSGPVPAGAQTDVCTGQTPPPAPTPAPASAARRAAAKLPIRGLIDLGQVSADNMHEPPYNTIYYVCQRPGAISAIVVNDTWSTLQRSSGGKIDTGTIDAALREIRHYNATSGHTLGVRLRVWAGIDAPKWAKAIGGTPVPLCDQNAVPASPSPSAVRPAATITPCPSVAVRTVGRFWTSAYQAAWRDVQQQLARKYDDDSLVNDVVMSSCSSLTSEPFVQPEDEYSKHNLIAAGYTDAGYEKCLAGAVATDFAPYWHVTPVAYSFNPFREIQPTPPAIDLEFTEKTIDACRATLGKRCILLNETMGKFDAPSGSSQARAYYQMWAFMRSRGGQISFQTASPPNLLLAWQTNARGWNKAIALAHRYGAWSVELFPKEREEPCITATRVWIAGYPCFSDATLQRWKTTITSL